MSRRTNAMRSRIIKDTPGVSQHILTPDQLLNHTHSQEKNLPVLDELAENGCTPAGRYAKGIRHFIKVNSLLDKKSHKYLPANLDEIANEVVLELSEAVKIDTRIPEWVPDKLKTATKISKLVMERLPNTDNSPPNRAAHICDVYFRTLSGNFESCLCLIDGGIRKYPDEVFFYFTKACVLAFLRRFRESLAISKIGLEKFPDSIDLLYTKASAMKSPSTNTKPKEYIKAYETFLQAAHQSDRHVAQFHYELASDYAQLLKGIKMQPQNRQEFMTLFQLVKKSFGLGLKAEENILPITPDDGEKYGHWKVVAAADIKNIRNNGAAYFKKIDNDVKVIKTNPINEQRQSQLNDSWRIELIQTHRQLLSAQKAEKGQPASDNNRSLEKDMADMKISENNSALEESQLKELKPIVLIEMDYAQERTYTGRIIELKSIEPAAISANLLILIVEDNDGDTQKCVIHGLDHSNDIDLLKKEFEVGCKLRIISPNLIVPPPEDGGKPFILVDNPENLLRDPKGRLENMCRYCGNGKAEMHCAQCHSAFYCDRREYRRCSVWLEFPAPACLIIRRIED